jgi:hypothetical protein
VGLLTSLLAVWHLLTSLWNPQIHFALPAMIWFYHIFLMLHFFRVLDSEKTLWVRCISFWIVQSEVPIARFNSYILYFCCVNAVFVEVTQDSLCWTCLEGDGHLTSQLQRPICCDGGVILEWTKPVFHENQQLCWWLNTIHTSYHSRWNHYNI